MPKKYHLPMNYMTYLMILFINKKEHNRSDMEHYATVDGHSAYTRMYIHITWKSGIPMKW